MCLGLRNIYKKAMKCTQICELNGLNENSLFLITNIVLVGFVGYINEAFKSSVAVRASSVSK